MTTITRYRLTLEDVGWCCGSRQIIYLTVDIPKEVNSIISINGRPGKWRIIGIKEV